MNNYSLFAWFTFT